VESGCRVLTLLLSGARGWTESLPLPKKESVLKLITGNLKTLGGQETDEWRRLTSASCHPMGGNPKRKMEQYLRAIAGTFALLSLALGYLYSPYWHLFTAFVGLNLLQSAFTRWCLMEIILSKLGVPET